MAASRASWFSGLIAGSVQGALMMPFTDAKIGAVQGSASGGTEPCPLCRGMSIWESPSFGVREARMSRTFILLGIILVAVGLLWPWTGWLRLGRLPGDIVVERQNFTLYFPITSGLLISVALTLFLWLVNR
jgi:hypothetical protein